MRALLAELPRTRHYVVLCGIALLLRLLVFISYIQYQERYRQPDSVDYHIGGWVLKQSRGFRYLDGRPLFWRTPGYPLFVSLFFDPSIKSPVFALHTQTHRTLLVVQIALCSMVPYLAGVLATVLTHSPLVIWASAIFATVHPGFVLASTYLLTDGLAALFFILFLICFFSVFCFPYETWCAARNHPYRWLIGAALSLSIYTWMRPMGQFIGLFASILLLLGAASGWKDRMKKALFFFMLFCATLAPWFVRNYAWTHQLFFCPLFGLYLNVFNAPKILARTHHISLEEAHARMVKTADMLVRKEHSNYVRERLPIVICSENICLRSAWPVIKEHPGYFLYDWCVEVCKTTFDLYACQLTALANNCFSWDPLVEYLPEKLYDCLWGKPMPWLFRVIAWTEMLFQLVLWIGILIGLWCFIVHPLMVNNWAVLTHYGYVWLKCGLFAAGVICQTGGFGYARLRLPVELLIFIAAFMGWGWVLGSEWVTPVDVQGADQ